MSDAQNSFWAIVEIMGHNTFAGLVGEQTLGGAAFVRVDVPQTGKSEAFTKLFGAASIYAVTPCSEQVARLRAEAIGAIPLTAWDLPEAIRDKLRSNVAALPAPPARSDQFDDSVSDSWGPEEDSGDALAGF